MRLNKKQASADENYLDKIPVRSELLSWTYDDKGIVTIDIENKGLTNRIFQRLINKPEVTHIHLDEVGSFIWIMIDGKQKISDFAPAVEKSFGEKIKPTYQRLARFFEILKSYNFINWSE